MTIYSDIEQAVADRLAPFGGANFEVRVLPENQNGYAQRPVNVGRITVAFHSSDVEKANSIGGMSQIETVNIAVAIQSKFLRGDKGVYNIAGLIRRYLVGFEPAGQDPMRAKAFGLDKATHEDNMWTYYAHYYTKTIAVSEDYESGGEALLQEITLINQVSGETNSFPEQNA